MRPAVRWIRLIAVAAVTVLICWGGLMLFEERLIYFPVRLPAGWTAAASGLLAGDIAVEECFFRTEDGLRLHGLFCRPAEGSGEPPLKVLLWFHGNAGNLADRLDMAADLCGLPAAVFIADYRGYGLSEGKPSEKGLYRDARAAWDYLTGERKLEPKRIVLFGKSLGGAAAIDLATRVEPAGLIVQSAFTSVPDMASVAMPFVPRFLVRTRMDNLAKIRQVRCPKLFIHSPADEVVPYAMGRRLFDAAPDPKAFYEVPHAGHNETWLAGGAGYREAIRGFLASIQGT